nr:TonB-dependent receptor [uncultured Lichenicoccus sp.]
MLFLPRACLTSHPACVPSLCVQGARVLAAGLLAASAGLIDAAHAEPQVEAVTVNADPSAAGASAPTAPEPDATEPASVIGPTALGRYVAPTGNYDDAIRLTPSVIDVAPNGPGLGEAQILSIRGFQDGQYNVTFDGIPFADSDDFTHHSSAYFVMRDLGSVTVDRGPGDATTFGDATFGGTVALRSIDPGAAGSVNPSVSGGSFGTSSGGVLLNTGARVLPGGAAAVLDAESVQSDGALAGAAQRRGTLFGKLVVPLDHGMTLTLLSNLSSTVQNEAPGATRGEIARHGPSVALNDERSSQSFEGYNSSAYASDLSYAELSRPMHAGLSFSDTVYSYGLNRHFGQGLDPGGETPNGTAFGPGDVPGQNGRNGLRAWGDIVRVEQDLPASVALKGGFWIERQTNARSLVETDESLGNVLNPVLAPVAGVAGSAAIDRQQAETLLTVQPSLQLDWQAERWLQLAGGLKGAWFERDVAAPLMEGMRLSTRFSAAAGSPLPSLTARLGLRRQWHAYAQIAQGFLAPTLQEFDVTDPERARVAPEATWNFQIGTAWRSRDLVLSADLYEILFEHAIGVRTVGGESLDFDEGRVTYRGIEAEGTGLLGQGFSLYGSGSLNQSRQSRGGTGASGPAPDTPQATLSTGLLFSRGRVNASLIDRWVGGSYGDVGRTHWIAPYNQLDLSAGRTLAFASFPPVALKLQVFNLLDSRKIDGLAGYTIAAAAPLFWTQAGRSIFVSATTRF